MSSLRAIVPVQFSVSIGTNEDWTDSWGYFDSYNNPLPGSYIALAMMMRATASSTTPTIVAASQPGFVQGVIQNGALSWGGQSGNLIILAIPRTTMQVTAPGSYIAEVQGTADGITRTIASIAVTVNPGVVR